MNDLPQQAASHAGRAVTAVGLAFGSWTLQDISHAVSIAAGLAAFVVSVHVLMEWWWKRLWRGVFVRWGWIKARR